MRLSWLPFLVLVACGGGELKTDENEDADQDDTGDDSGSVDSGDTEDTEDTGETGDTEDTGRRCDATILQVSPADGDVDVAIDTVVRATFSDPVDAADIDIQGIPGTVTLTDGGYGAVFTPDGALDRDTDYTATVGVCDDETEVTFTTVGEALELDLTGRTFDVDLAGSDLTWVEPSATLGEMMMGQVETTHILLGVEAVDTVEIDLVGAAGFLFGGTELRQYPCTYAIDFDPADYSSNPAFDVGPMDAELGSTSVTVEIYELTVDGVFSDDGEEMQDVHISGLIDARPLTESTGVDVCETITYFGGACTTCPDGEEQCIALEVIDASAPWNADITIDPAQDPTTDRYCN